MMMMMVMVMVACGGSSQNSPDASVDAATPICAVSGSGSDDATCASTFGSGARGFTCEQGADPRHPVPGKGYDNCYETNALLCCK